MVLQLDHCTPGLKHLFDNINSFIPVRPHCGRIVYRLILWTKYYDVEIKSLKQIICMLLYISGDFAKRNLEFV